MTYYRATFEQYAKLLPFLMVNPMRDQALPALGFGPDITSHAQRRRILAEFSTS